jgi:hypothetical protein
MASSLQNSPTTIEIGHGLQEQANKLYTNRKVSADIKSLCNIIGQKCDFL